MSDAQKPPDALDWTDVNAVKVWARGVCITARDAIGAGEDATRPPGKRELGRAAARRIIEDTGSQLDHAMQHAGIREGDGVP